jgi:TolB protein
MRHKHFFVGALATATTVLLAVEAGQLAQQPQTQQPDAVKTVLIGDPGMPPKLAVPEFIPLGKEPEVVSAAKAIGDVLWDDFAFEKEFYMIPRDVLRTVPRPASVEQVPLDQWKALGADGVVIGTVAKAPDGIVVEVRLLKVTDGTLAVGKKYTGSLRSVADGGRVYAHSFADEVHKTQRNLRGVALTKLAFSSDRDGGRMKGPLGEREISNIYQADYDGANQTRLTVTRSLDLAPALAPDRGQIAYTSYRSGFPDIILQSLRDSRAPISLTKGTGDNQNYLPAWSPDGTKIAYMSNRDGNPEIYISNPDGSGVRRVTNHPMVDATPTFSPTGTQLAFTSDRGGSPQVYIVNIDGTGLVKITNETHCDRATWGPLNEIAYASRSGGGFDIKVYEIATRESRTITDGTGSNESPAFAPNGRHLAFVSDRTGKQQIYTVARDGTSLRQITKVGINKYPNWSQ